MREDRDTNSDTQQRILSVVIGGSFAIEAECCGLWIDSSLVLDLSSFKDKLPGFYGESFGPRVYIVMMIIYAHVDGNSSASDGKNLAYST